MQYLPEPHQNTTTSAKPFLIGLAAIFLLIGLFILKSYGTTSNENPQVNDSADEEALVDVPLIQPKEVAKLIINSHYQLVDIREKPLYQEKHIQNSVNIPFSVIESSSKLFDKNRTIIIIDEKNTTQGKVLTNHLIEQKLEAKYMEGGFERYYMESMPVVSYGNPDSLQDQAKASPLTAAELYQRTARGELFKFIDVRSASDYEASHIEGAVNIPLEEIEQRKKRYPVRKDNYLR